MSPTLLVEIKRIAYIYDVPLDFSNEGLIDNFRTFVNWTDICWSQDLSEEFIREFQNDVNWYWIFTFQDLSEGFIREFQHKGFWHVISEVQNLSDEFIREFFHKLHPDLLIKNNYVSEKIKTQLRLFS